MEDHHEPKKPKLDSLGVKQCEFVEEETIATGKWLCLKNVTYKDPNGVSRKWEMATRTTKQEGAADGVLIIATLRRSSKSDCLVCVKQYRPPMKAYSLEFPAGLIDAGETAEQAAVRELREETGYTGAVIRHVSPATSLDPGAENCTLSMVTVDINGDDPANQSPKQHLDETEFIEIHLIPVADLLTQIREFTSAGIIIDSRVYAYALATSSTASTH